MSNHSTKYLVCYDICNPKRLRRVHKEIRDWGVPIQFSIFEIDVNTTQLARLKALLIKMIDVTEDKIMFYRLMPKQERICLGLNVQTEDLLFI